LSGVLNTYVPGYFKVEDQDDTIAGFRGLAPDSNAKVLLLLNGMNMNTEWQFGPPDAFLNGLNLDYIERIEIIRGPGSVTLGQGALLGVINIVTKTGETSPKTSVLAGAGKDGFQNLNLQAGSRGELIPELKTYFYLSDMRYRGQELKSKGWTRERAYEGVEVQGLEILADPRENQGLRLQNWNGIPVYANIASASGNRLQRSQNQMAHGIVQYKSWNFQMNAVDHNRDIYNFYRDRNRVTNELANFQLSHEWNLMEKLKFNWSAFFTRDDFGFSSHRGVNMAGTREERYGGKGVFQWNVTKTNTLALGTEFRRYDLGRRDENGNNFIVNRAEPGSFFNLTRNIANPFQVNETNRFVFPQRIDVASIFLEDVQKIGEKWDLFGAFRFDKHPFWGSNISPRIGAIYSPDQLWRFRASYQEGFRGAVGVAYTGGYQRDGLLRTSNFDDIFFAQVPNRDANGNPTFFQNIPVTRPEKMRSFELATQFKPNSRWKTDGVLFYNMIENVIDVGVIYPNPDTNPAPRIGTDEPGDWKGYFFWRNTPGILRQGGAEVSLEYKSQSFWSIGGSYAGVRVLGATTELHQSQYLTSDTRNPHFKAFPENVFRAHLHLFSGEKWSFAWNHLYYASWFAPNGTNVRGMHLTNATILYQLGENLEFSFSVKNVLNAQGLYPINNVANDVSLAAGTPSYEGRTYWASLRSSF